MGLKFKSSERHRRKNQILNNSPWGSFLLSRSVAQVLIDYMFCEPVKYVSQRDSILDQRFLRVQTEITC